jgi:hypothetical protein
VLGDVLDHRLLPEYGQRQDVVAALLRAEVQPHRAALGVALDRGQAALGVEVGEGHVQVEHLVGEARRSLPLRSGDAAGRRTVRESSVTSVSTVASPPAVPPGTALPALAWGKSRSISCSSGSAQDLLDLEAVLHRQLVAQRLALNMQQDLHRIASFGP